jgi:nifR3 family TIM-barrel protein
MKIGDLDLGNKPIFLAPMEDVSDPPFRVLCKRFGADLLYTEFISSGGLVHAAEDSMKKLDIWEKERPVAIQIFGGNVEYVRQAARIVAESGPEIIDINFGCPVKKVIRQEAGAAVLRDLPKMKSITEAVIDSVSCPVTVKTRLGWDEHSIRILEVAEMLQGVGIAALAVHARTRSQLYKGAAQWDWLSRIKSDERIRIPIIGNGDASTPGLIRAMFEDTGVDAVMVGRGAIGNPWIFREARVLLESGELPPPPTWDERLSVVAEHIQLKCDWLGERRGVLEMRKMYTGYFKGFRGSSRMRSRLVEETDEKKLLEVLLNLQEADAAGKTQVALSVPVAEG